MSEWITCRQCEGTEGDLVDGDWVSCDCCQGEGGRIAGESWSCRCEVVDA